MPRVLQCCWATALSLVWGMVVATEYARIVNGGRIDVMSGASTTALFWVLGIAQGAVAAPCAMFLAVRRNSLRAVILVLMASGLLVELAWVSARIGLFAPLVGCVAAALGIGWVRARRGAPSASTMPMS